MTIDEEALEKAADAYLRINHIVCTPSLRAAITAYEQAKKPAIKLENGSSIALADSGEQFIGQPVHIDFGGYWIGDTETRERTFYPNTSPANTSLVQKLLLLIDTFKRDNPNAWRAKYRDKFFGDVDRITTEATAYLERIKHEN